MTYNISKQLQQITENKDAFQFDLNSYKAATLQELENYKKTGAAENLVNIAINTILLIADNQGVELIGNDVKALPVKKKHTELTDHTELIDLEKIISNIQHKIKNNIFTKANARAILRTTGSFIELQKKNFRRELASQIQARLAKTQ